MTNDLELRKAFDDSVGAGNRLLASSLIILLLLAVVVEFELYDRRVRRLTLESRLIEEKAKLVNAERGVSRDLLKIDTTSFPDKDVIGTARKAIKAADPKLLDGTVADLQKQREGEAARPSQEHNQKLLRELNLTIRVLERLQQELSSLKEAKGDIKKTITSIQGDLKTHDAEDEQSIPTPFGTFDIHPRLGLLLLSVASVAAYVTFAAAESRATRALVRVARADKQVENRPDLPFWLFPLSPAVPSEWRRGTTCSLGQIAGIALQSLWLTFGLWLVLECTGWNRIEPLWYTSSRPLTALLWTGISIQAALTLHWIFRGVLPRISEPLDSTIRSLRSGVTRRRFLTIAGGTLIVVAGGRWLWSIAKRQQLLPVPSEELVINTMTETVHHRRLCAGHLPHSRHQTVITGGVRPEKLHKSRKAAIYQALAGASSNNMAATYLEAAIKISPTSIHLYDQLTRLYGSQRRYEEIDRLLAAGIERSQRELKGDGLTPSRRRTLQRAITNLEERTGRVKKRVLRSANNKGRYVSGRLSLA